MSRCAAALYKAQIGSAEGSDFVGKQSGVMHLAVFRAQNVRVWFTEGINTGQRGEVILSSLKNVPRLL